MNPNELAYFKSKCYCNSLNDMRTQAVVFKNYAPQVCIYCKILKEIECFGVEK